MLHVTSSGITSTACKFCVLGDCAYYYIIYDQNYMWASILSWKKIQFVFMRQAKLLMNAHGNDKECFSRDIILFISRARTILTVWWMSSCLGPKLGPHWSSASNHSVFTRYLCPCQEFLFLCVLFYSLPWKAESQNIFWVAKACLFLPKLSPCFMTSFLNLAFKACFMGAKC